MMRYGDSRKAAESRDSIVSRTEVRRVDLVCWAMSGDRAKARGLGEGVVSLELRRAMLWVRSRDLREEGGLCRGLYKRRRIGVALCECGLRGIDVVVL